MKQSKKQINDPFGNNIFEYIYFPSIIADIFELKPGASILERDQSGNYMEQRRLTFEEVCIRFDLDTTQSELDLIQSVHTIELKRAVENLRVATREYLLFPNSDDLQESKNYLEYIIGLYITWFHKHNLDIPLDYEELNFLGPDFTEKMDSLNLSTIEKHQRKKKNSGQKEIPSRGLKELAKEACEALIKEKVIITVLEEKKSDKCISTLVIAKLEKEYELTLANKKSISDYFRKHHLVLKKSEDGKLKCIDTYPRIKK